MTYVPEVNMFTKKANISLIFLLVIIIYCSGFSRLVVVLLKSHLTQFLYCLGVRVCLFICSVVALLKGRISVERCGGMERNVKDWKRVRQSKTGRLLLGEVKQTLFHPSPLSLSRPLSRWGNESNLTYIYN